jgi:hypothetical protein
MPLFRRNKSKPTEKKKVVSQMKKNPASPSKVPIGLTSSNGSELKVEENKFYILIRNPQEDDEEDGKDIMLYSEVKASITRIKEYLKNGIDVNNIELMTVTIMDEALEAESVPWNKIAVELIG